MANKFPTRLTLYKKASTGKMIRVGVLKNIKPAIGRASPFQGDFIPIKRKKDLDRPSLPMETSL